MAKVVRLVKVVTVLSRPLTVNSPKFCGLQILFAAGEIQ